jgi:hypothetical protein
VAAACVIATQVLLLPLKLPSAMLDGNTLLLQQAMHVQLRWCTHLYKLLLLVACQAALIIAVCPELP